MSEEQIEQLEEVNELVKVENVEEQISEKVKGSKWKKPLLRLGLAMLAVFLYSIYILFSPNIFPRTEEKAFLCIPDSSNFDTVINLLENEAKVWNVSAFKQVSGLLRYGNKIRPGKYELKKGMNLSNVQKQQLIAFLKTLTDYKLLSDKRFY
jgi:cell division protein YceG involved in septum cleavage